MKRIILFLMICASVSAFAQGVDERIGATINQEEWHLLRSIYEKEGAKLQTPFLHPLSRFFICHSYNQPDSALFYGGQILKDYQAALGGSVGSLLFLMSSDFAKIGEFDNAASILKQYNDAVKASGAAPDPIFVAYENQYDAIARKGGFSVLCPPKDIKVPLRYLNLQSKSGQIRVDIHLNRRPYDAVFDTGAGENVMSQRLAAELGLHVYDFSGTAVAGINVSKTYFTIVDSMQLGEIVYKNVPFQVVDFSTGHQEADSVIKEINMNCIIGLRSMLPLNEIQLDFKNGFLKIPAYPGEMPSFAPNIYYSGDGLLAMSVIDKKTNKNIDAMLDTGAAITNLTSKYYRANKHLFDNVVADDSVRIAGIGGVKILKTFSTSWEYSIDGSRFMKEPVTINIDEDSDSDGVSRYDCLFGLPSFSGFDCVTINFKDMFVKVE
ncbi:MAG: retropepsin-like aspartic protease [Muribaculaceae bacterium]|nr:retropepsin-like aspartic protease [Muribaculaceae bacterium]